eukprot:6807116-Prymnesium_polylepis.1
MHKTTQSTPQSTGRCEVEISRYVGGTTTLGGAKVGRGGGGKQKTRKREGPGRAQGAEGKSRGAAVSSVASVDRTRVAGKQQALR